MNTLLFTNAQIVLEMEVLQGSLLIKDGKVAGLYGRKAALPAADEILDIEGKYILPGGIDPHVHLHLTTPNGISSDDFYSGSKAALKGGTTSIIDFITPRRGQSMLEAIAGRKTEAKTSLVDYTFHLTPVEWTENTAQEMIQAIHSEHITSFKVYMAYKESIGLEDDALEMVLRTAGRFGGIVLVHAEKGDEIARRVEELHRAQKTSPRYHPVSRPPHTEIEAVEKIVRMATANKCPLYVVHTSCGSSIERVYEKALIKSGSPVFFETCPQYLLFNDEVYQSSQENALAFMMSPPLRPLPEQKLLKKYFLQGKIQSIGTDHCPFTREQKNREAQDFSKIPNGAGGIEYRMQLIFNEMIVKEGKSIIEFVKLVAGNPAKIFGLYPRKGVIQKGSDADLVIWDPDKDFVIDTGHQWQQTDINIYEGYRGKGAPVAVFRRGRKMIENDRLTGTCKGTFLPRKPWKKESL